MRVTTVTYSENLPGQGYKTHRAEVTVEVKEGESSEAGMNLAKTEVRRALGLDVTREEAEAALAVVAKARAAGVLPKGPRPIPAE